MTNATATPTTTAPAQAEFKGLQDWIEVFRAGTHTDSKGNSHTFTSADLDQMVSNVELGKPPAVLGHPKHNDPAYGWAELKRDGEALYAKFSDINPAFEKGVESGAYRNRSVAVFKQKDKGWRVRHVGWLGAVPPALDGLTPLAFEAEEVELFEFAAQEPEVSASYALCWAVESAARLMRGFRDHLIEQSGVEVADRVLPSWSIDEMQASAERARTALAQAEADEVSPAFSSQPTPEGGDMPGITKEDLERAREEGRKEAEAQASAQFSAQGQELAELRAARINDRVGTQVNGWVASGLVMPAEEPGLKAFMVALENDGAAEFTFSAADNTEVKQTPAQWFATFMAGRKPLVKLGRDARMDETLPEPVSNDARVIADRAMAFMKEQEALGITVSYAEAVSKFSTPMQA